MVKLLHGHLKKKKPIEFWKRSSDKKNFLTWRDKSITSPYRRPSSMMYPLARYAARNWLKHAKLAEKGTSKITLLSMELFQGKTEAVFNRLRLRHAEYPFSGPYSDKDSFDIAHPLYYYASLDLTESVEIPLNDEASFNVHGGDCGNAFGAVTRAKVTP